MIYFDTSISWIGSNTRHTAIAMSSWRHNIKTKNQEEVPFGDIDGLSFAFSLVCRAKYMTGSKIWYLNGLIIVYNDVEKCAILSYAFISFVPLYLMFQFLCFNTLRCLMVYIASCLTSSCLMISALCWTCLSYNNALCLFHLQTDHISLKKEKTDSNHPIQSPRTMAEWKKRENRPIQTLGLNKPEHRELPNSSIMDKRQRIEHCPNRMSWQNKRKENRPIQVLG
mgnify:CR=1 FL=1